MDIVRAYNKQIRLLIIICLCLLSLSGTVYAASSTMEAFQTFHRQRVQYALGDVHSIRSWMTIPYISLTYHVPSSYLYQTLRIKNKQEERDTLQTIATHRKRPVNELIATIQQAILTYRRDNSGHPPPTPDRLQQARRDLY